MNKLKSVCNAIMFVLTVLWTVWMLYVAADYFFLTEAHREFFERDWEELSLYEKTLTYLLPLIVGLVTWVIGFCLAAIILLEPFEEKNTEEPQPTAED